MIGTMWLVVWTGTSRRTPIKYEVPKLRDFHPVEGPDGKPLRFQSVDDAKAFIVSLVFTEGYSQSYVNELTVMDEKEAVRLLAGR
jgi:hypothetical protein